MNVLIAGGSSGLGLALAKELADQKHRVIVTGRKDPRVDFAKFQKFDLSQSDLPKKIEQFVKALPPVNALFYVAGFYQSGTVTDLSPKQIEDMLSVGGREPIYYFIKAGEGQFSNSVAEDGRIKKVLVAGPSGMRTEFWDGVKHSEWDDFLDKEWVAQQIMKTRSGKYKYKFIKILRQPTRVEIVETR